MSSYVNSEGVVRESWKGSENNGKVLGYNGPNSPNTKKPSYLQRVFGSRKHNTSGLNSLVKRGKANTRRNNGQVPKYAFNATSQFSTKGFVSKNTGNTLQARMGAFQQNFIKRIYAEYQDAKIGKKPLNLEGYATELESETDEAKAILLYNELILLFILISVDCIEKLVDHRLATGVLNKIKGTTATNSNPNLRLFISRITTLGVLGGVVATIILTGGIAFIGELVLALMFYGVALSGLSAATSILTSKIYLVIYPANLKTRGIGRLSISPLDVNGDHEYTGIDDYTKNGLQKISYTDIFNTINKILFSETNHIKIQSVKDKLKYWGLLQGQVDYIFQAGQNFRDDSLSNEGVRDYLEDIIKFYRNDGNRTLAPNEPLSEEQLKAAYPKPELLHKNNVLEGGVTRRRRKHQKRK
jgi:hypothetical protein